MEDSDHSQNSQKNNMICPSEEHPEAPETSLIITDRIRSYSTLAKYPLRRSTYSFLPSAVAYQKQAIRSFKLISGIRYSLTLLREMNAGSESEFHEMVERLDVSKMELSRTIDREEDMRKECSL